jgi:adenylylsulfate kinase-like enzyme
MDQKNNTGQQQKKDTSNNDKEKWLYGLAGAGIGSLLTYLFMDNQNKKERRNGLDGIDEERTERRIEKISLK